MRHRHRHPGHRDADRALVERTWEALAGGTTADPHVRRLVGDDLLRRWSQPHRRYHTLRHLAEVLQTLTTLPAGACPRTRLAALFHDAVYEPTAPAGANEEASARLLETLGAGCDLDPDLVAAAAALVRMTAAHRPDAHDRAALALADADLAILAAPADRYLEYASAVRAEYAHLTDDAFDAGRLAVLRDLYARTPLFGTKEGRARFERAAKDNLAGEIAMLSRRATG